MINYFIIAFDISKQLDIWNKKLDSIIGSFMDNVWAGPIMFGLLFIFGCWGISALTKK